jgi:lysozyme
MVKLLDMAYFKSNEGFMYEGRWKNDKKDGFGMAIFANNKLKIGEWKNNIYKGERPYYTSERIYGIDISKYQHIVGQKKIWNKLESITYN